MSGSIVAIGGLSPNHNDEPLHRLIVDLAKQRKPHICYVPLASGDFEPYVEYFYELYPTSICKPRHLELLRTVTEDPAEVLSAQDIVYLGGGNTPVLVSALRVLGLSDVLEQAWARGGVLCGDSAGAHAWFEGCITDSLGPAIRRFPDGLGIATGTCVAHFDHERAAMLENALWKGQLPEPGWGIDEGTALILSNGTAEAVSARTHGGAARFTLQEEGVSTRRLEVRSI